MSSQTSQFDIIVAGGGATGLSFLLALQHFLAKTKFENGQPLKVALVETWSSDSAQQHPGFDARAIALSQQTLSLFRELGHASAITACTAPIKSIHVSDQGGAGQCTLDHEDYQVTELGAVIEAQQLGAVLAKAAEQNIQSEVINLTRFQPEQISEVKQAKEKVSTTLKSGKSIEAALLILAEGGQSATRQQLPIKVTTTDYQQSAIIANVLTEKPHNNTAYERFTAQGPLAFLPMSENRSGVVWSVASGRLSELLTMPDETFINELQRAFGYRLGRITKTGKRASFPLALIQADDSAAHRAVCIGNASQTLHPIAGQGFNLAIRDAWCLAANLAESVAQHDDPGSFKRLNAFRQIRSKDKHNTILLTDGLVRLFSNKNPLLQAARNVGLIGMQLNDLSKSTFANMAMGKHARLTNPVLNKSVKS